MVEKRNYPKKRKPPIRHRVRSYVRKTKTGKIVRVRSHWRGRRVVVRVPIRRMTRRQSVEGVKVLQIRTQNDLKKVDCEWLLDSYPFSEIKGLYFDVPDSEKKIVPVGTKRITFGAIVHGRLYPEKVTAYVDEKGDIYIPVEKLEELF